MDTCIKPYPGYKDTRQVWLGNIPSHWGLLPNRAIFEEVKEREHPDEEMLSVTINNGIIRQKTLLSGSSKKDSSRLDKSAYKLVQPNDLAYNKMRAWQGAIGVSGFRGIISPAYVVMRLRKKHLPRYFHHLYRTPYFAKESERWSYGITSDMWSLRPEHFKMIHTPLPPPDEQAAIVRFLDYENARIEKVIRSKKKLIILLNEQKQAIIHQAVTRGLDPNVKLKASGIPWLGDIPKHWDARAFARLARVIRGASPRPAGDTRFFNGDFIPWLTVGEITKDQSIYLEKTESSLTRLGAEHSVVFPKGTLVLTNSGATLGVPKILGVDVCANDGVVAFERLSLIVNPVFAYYYLSTLTVKLRDELRQGGTQPNLNTGIVRNIVCPIPPKEEQSAILTFLKSELKIVHTSISCTEREISLLREYRTRLIADVVTGKLDVRKAAKDLPEESDRSDLSDFSDLVDNGLERSDGDFETIGEEES